MITEKKVVAKLTLKTTHSTLILLVFAHSSGMVTYHLMGELTRGNRSLEELDVKKPLPCVTFDYVNSKNLINAIVSAIDSGGVARIISRSEYCDTLS